MEGEHNSAPPAVPQGNSVVSVPPPVVGGSGTQQIVIPAGGAEFD